MQWFLPAVATAALVAAGCRQAPENAAVENEPSEAVTPLPRLPLAESSLDRAALLTAVAKAASATALGKKDEGEERGLDGKPFEIRVRFGCLTGGPRRSVAGPFNVRFDAEDRTLRIRAAPDLTLDDPKIASRAGEAAESVEGFWMYRPWLLAAGCPAAPPASATAAEAPQPGAEAVENESAADAAAAPPALSAWRVGIAQFFSESDSRTRRRDQRAYEATKRLDADETPSPQGYDLVLAGRLRKFPDGRVISCAVVSVDLPPECVVSAEFDRVSIVQPVTGEVLAQWGS